MKKKKERRRKAGGPAGDSALEWQRQWRQRLLHRVKLKEEKHEADLLSLVQ
jgi:hypothetical protein